MPDNSAELCRAFSGDFAYTARLDTRDGDPSPTIAAHRQDANPHAFRRFNLGTHDDFALSQNVVRFEKESRAVGKRRRKEKEAGTGDETCTRNLYQTTSVTRR